VSGPSQGLERALVDLAYAAEAIASGRLSSLELVKASIRRYRATEPQVHAFAWLDERRAIDLARRCDSVPSRGRLHGVPVAVKDIFDTAGVPTERGSPLFKGRVPTRSSAVVTALESAGAVIVGKTVTAELAYYAPGPTRNPWDFTRTPGGSSQGSAAAVAAGVVPGSVGSQTNGSTIRPAAYCGVVGFKPTVRRISTSGVLHFSRSLDHVGTFTRGVRDAGLLAAVLAKQSPEEWIGGVITSPRFAVVQTSDWDSTEVAMRTRFLADVDALAGAGAEVNWPELPIDFDDAARLVDVVMAYESARLIGPIAFEHPQLVSRQARALFERGRATSLAEYRSALRKRRNLVSLFRLWIAPYDAILTPPAIGEAPDWRTTGDPRFCSRWSLVGAPALSMPTGLGPCGLPLGIQLVGRPGDDRRLLAAARWAEARLRPPRFEPPLGSATVSSFEPCA
jgi:Asp-tRNA(Asn)/Glu-tRNA(Gln) amidotransferase A subunit family amidase